MFQVRGKTLNRSANSAKLIRLTSSTRYLICVLSLGNWIANHQIDQRLNDSNQGNTNNDILSDENQALLTETSTSRCTEVTTLTATPSLITDENGLSSHGIIHSLLTRRLGLIVGCCLGIIVFIVLISVLGYLKIKKQRIDNAKRQPPLPPEYMTYRHFSMTHDEANHRDGCLPNSIVGTTMLNS